MSLLKYFPAFALIACATIVLSPAPKTIATPLTEVQQLHFSQVSATARASYDRGLAKFNQDDFKGAIAEFDQALKAQPNYPEALNWRGNAYRNLNEPKKAMADFNQAIQLKPDYSRPYNNRSFAKGRLGDIEGAIADLNVAIRLEPTLGIAYDSRGRILIHQGKTEAALKDFRQAVQLAPKNGSFYNNLCEGELKAGNDQAGFDACDRAISLGYKDPIVYANRGAARMQLDQRDPLSRNKINQNAIKDFDEAIKLNPEQAEAYNNRGRNLIHGDQSQRQAAIRDLETALRLFKQQGTQSKETLADMEIEIAYLKLPPAKKDEKADDPDLLKGFDEFFAEFSKTLTDQNNSPIAKPQDNPSRAKPKAISPTADEYFQSGMNKEKNGDLKGGITDLKKAIALYEQQGKGESESAKTAKKLLSTYEFLAASGQESLEVFGK